MTQLATFPLFDDECAFSLAPNQASTRAAINAAWVSLGSRALAVSGVQQGRAYELAQVQAGSGTYTLRDDDEALNPVNTGSPYYPNVLPFRRFRTIAAWTTGGGWSGNVLNDTNAAWIDTPMSAQDASFEGGVSAGVGAPNVGVVTPTAAGPTSTVPYPTTTHAGAFAFLIVDCHGTNTPVTTPAGWTLYHFLDGTSGALDTVGTTIPSLFVYVSTSAMTGTEGGTSVTVSHGSVANTCFIVEYSGVDPTIWDVTLQFVDHTTTSTSCVIPAITPVTANCTLMYVAASNGIGQTAGAIPAGFTQLTNATGGDGSVLSGYQQNVPAISSGTVTVTWSGSGKQVGMLLALRPATGSGTTIGDWVPGGTGTVPALTNSTTHAQDGTHALKATFAAAPGTAAGAYLTVGVIPGQQVTVSAYVWLAASLTSATINVTGYGSGTTDSTVGSFVRVSKTFTPLTPTVVLSITFAGSGAGSAWIDAVQVEYSASPTAFSTTGPTMYADFTGYAERWPETWERQGYWGRSDVPVVDVFAAMARTTLQDVYTQEVISDSPTCLYQLRDAVGSATAADFLEANAPGVVQGYSQLVAGVTTLASFGDNQSVLVDAFPSLKITAESGAWAPYVALPTSATPGSGPWTVEADVFLPPTVVGASNLIVDQGAYSGTGQSFVGFSLSINVATPNPLIPGTTTVQFIAFAGQQFTTGDPTLPNALVSSPATYGLGAHHLAVTLGSDNKTLTLFVDGVQAGQTVASSAMPVSANPLYVGAGNFQVEGVINIGDYALYPGVLADTRIAAHAAAALTAFTGELSGARYQRIVNYKSSGIQSVIDAGMTLMGPATGLQNTSLLQACTDVVTAESGQQWVGRDGRLVFAGRARRYTSHSSVWTFGENAAGGEIPYQSSLAFDFDTQYVYNDVTATRPGGVPQHTVDATSQGVYFDSTLTVTPNVQQDTEARDYSTWTVQQHKDSHLRTATLTVNPTADGRRWPVALGMQQGDRVTVKRRTASGFTINLDFYVELINRDRGEASYGFTATLSPIWTTSVWILGDATYSVLGTTTILAR
jgi:hypothetical protein